MGKIADALRSKFSSPREAIKALGLDEALLSRENLMTDKRPTKLAARTLVIAARGIAPLLAMDAKVDLKPVVWDLTTKNFKPKMVVERLRTAIRGKTIAKDAGLEHVEEGLKKLEEPSEDMRRSFDESVSEPQHKAMEAAAHGHSNLDIPQKVGEEFVDADKRAGDNDPASNLGSFLESKGMDALDVKRALDMLPKHHAMDVHHYHGARDESEAEEAREKREKEAEDRSGAKDAKHHHHYAGDESGESEEERERKKREAEDARRRADDAARGARDKMVTKDEMSAAVKKAVEDERKNQGEIRLALDEARPLIGELREDMAFDTADDVRRHVLKAKGKDPAGINSAGLKAMVAMLPRGDGETREPRRGALAMDAAARSGFNERFGDAKRLHG